MHTLEQAQCVAEKNEVDLEPLNLGLISAFYYVKVATIGEVLLAFQAFKVCTELHSSKGLPLKRSGFWLYSAIAIASKSRTCV